MCNVYFSVLQITMSMNNHTQASQKSNALSIAPQSQFVINTITSSQNFFFLFVSIIHEFYSLGVYFYSSLLYDVQFSLIFAFKFLIQRQKHCEEGYLMFYSEFYCICFSCAKYLLGTQTDSELLGFSQLLRECLLLVPCQTFFIVFTRIYRPSSKNSSMYLLYLFSPPCVPFLTLIEIFFHLMTLFFPSISQATIISTQIFILL